MIPVSWKPASRFMTLLCATAKGFSCGTHPCKNKRLSSKAPTLGKQDQVCSPSHRLGGLWNALRTQARLATSVGQLNPHKLPEGAWQALPGTWQQVLC